MPTRARNNASIRSAAPSHGKSVVDQDTAVDRNGHPTLRSLRSSHSLSAVDNNDRRCSVAHLVSRLRRRRFASEDIGRGAHDPRCFAMRRATGCRVGPRYRLARQGPSVPLPVDQTFSSRRSTAAADVRAKARNEWGEYNGERSGSSTDSVPAALRACQAASSARRPPRGYDGTLGRRWASRSGAIRRVVREMSSTKPKRASARPSWRRDAPVWTGPGVFRGHRLPASTMRTKVVMRSMRSKPLTWFSCVPPTVSSARAHDLFGCFASRGDHHDGEGPP